MEWHVQPWKESEMRDMTVNACARPRISILVLSAAAVLGLVLSPCTLEAQTTDALRSNPTGFVLGAHLNGTALDGDDFDEVESGGGVGILVGYGFTRMVTVYLGADAASMDAPDMDDAYTFGQGDLGVRLHFGGPARAAVFYVDGAFTTWLARYDIAGSDMDATGTGFTLGGGLEYFFSPGFALDVGLKVTSGNFDEVSYEGDTESMDLDATSTRFNLGVTWYPGG